MNSKATTAIFHDKRRAKKDGTFPVKLRITYQRVQRLYAIDCSLSEEDFVNVMSARPRKEHKEIKLMFSTIEAKALGVIESLSDFSFPAFEKQFWGNPINKKDVFGAIEDKIKRLEEDERVGNADFYKSTLNSLSGFKTKLAFEDITVDLLKAYEKWMLGQSHTLTTVSMYLRCLRAVYNDAIKAGIVKRERYPFGRDGYKVPAGSNIKKALKLAEIEKIVNYQPKTESEERNRDYWFFSYLCNGMNIKDMARLKYDNIKGKKIIYIRAKTEHTSRQSLKPIVAVLTSHVETIIEKWGNKPVSPDSFIFPFITAEMDARQVMARTRQVTKTINKYIKRIAVAVGLEEDITTYTARHSFATVLKRSGASMELIGEMLGHSDHKTTQNYLDSFEDSIKEEHVAHLTAFVKK